MTDIPAGGTNCSAPLAWLNQRSAGGSLVIFVSDNQSWVDQTHNRGTATMVEWEKFKARSPRAKLVCIDLQPYSTVQATDTGRDDVLNIGGFSDYVFDLIAQFASGKLNTNHWVGVIESESLEFSKKGKSRAKMVGPNAGRDYIETVESRPEN